MSQIASRLFLLLTLLLSTKLTVAQSLYSEFLNYNTSITTANATGIYELPGLLFGRDGLNVSTDPSQIWHLTQTIARRPSDLVTYGNSYLTIPSDQLPLSNSSLKAQYSACVRFFSVPDDLARTSQSQADDGSCSYILGADCVKDLKDLHLRQATAWANEEHTEAEFCTGYFDTIKVADYPSSCRNSSKEIFSGSQGAGTITSSTYYNSLLVNYYFDVNGYSPTDLASSGKRPPKDATDFSVYDAAVRSIRPIIIARIGNLTTNTNDRSADVEIVCARAKDVRAGSRIPEMNSAEAVARVGSWILGLAALVGVVAGL